MEVFDLVKLGVDDFPSVLLPLEADHEEEHDEQQPKHAECAISAELGQGVDHEDFSPGVVDGFFLFRIDQKDLYLQFVGLFDERGNQPKSDHQTKNDVKGGVERCLIRHKGVDVGSGFGEDEPVGRGQEEEIEHPQGPDVDEV